MAQDAIINRWDINGDVYDIQDAGRGRPLGVATLDENGRVPYTQLPESAVEFKGYWDASTNTPTLHDGTGTKGDLYYVSVAGTQDLGSGSQVFEVGDRVLYDGSVWMNMKSGGTDIEVYPTLADAEADLANLEDGDWVSTPDGNGGGVVDIVERGNMNAVTSNAVAELVGQWQRVLSIDSLSWIDGISNDNGRDLAFHFAGCYAGSYTFGSSSTPVFTLPNGWRPTSSARIIVMLWCTEVNDRIAVQIDIMNNGIAVVQDLTRTGRTSFTTTGFWGDFYLHLM